MNQEELEDELEVDSSTSKSNSQRSSSNQNLFQNRTNLFKGQKYNPFENIGNKNLSVGQGLRNMVGNHGKSENVTGGNQKNSIQDAKEKVASKAISTGITAATGGAVHGKTAELAGKIASKFASSFLEQYKKKILIWAIVSSLPIVVILVIIMGQTSSADIGFNTVGYTTSSMTDEDLIKQLQHYGYCKSDIQCKNTGIYQTYQKLKSIYEEYRKPCPSTLGNNSPCGITINTGLILETINYYNYSEESNQMDLEDIEKLNEIDENEKNTFLKGLLTLGYYIESAINKQKELDSLLQQIEDLALAQSEYIREDCGDTSKYFYQVSFNKYISYLQFGTSSSHENYKNNTYRLVQNETCQGPQNDYIEGSNDSSTSNETITGSGMGVDIVNYALKYVGHPYVFGKKNLCDNWEGNPNCAIDCSGFTKSIMAKFGINIPDGSANQRNAGTNIGTDFHDALPGDIICYEGHVAIYMGDSRIVHASNPKEGVKISDNVAYRPILAIIRVWE